MSITADINNKIFRRLVDEPLVIADLASTTERLLRARDPPCDAQTLHPHYSGGPTEIPFEHVQTACDDESRSTFGSRRRRTRRAVDALERVLSSSCAHYADVMSPAPKKWTLVPDGQGHLDYRRDE